MRTQPFIIETSKYQFLKFQLMFIASDKHFTKMELELLIYYYLYPTFKEAEERFITDGKSVSMNSLYNYKGRLRREGFLLKDEDTLNPDIKLTTDFNKYIYQFKELQTENQAPFN